MPPLPRVVVIGSGFGGLNAAKRLRAAPVEVTVVDRDNYHGFWPLLYQVATAGLAPDDIAWPVRAIYGKQTNTSVRMGTVTGVDLDDRMVTVEHEPPLPYDYLIVATGTVSNDFGIPGLNDHAFPLKSLPDAVRLRNHVLETLEAADADPDSDLDRALSFVLVGGGPTGVEMAGALAELVAHNLVRDFPRLDFTRARVILLEQTDRLLTGFSAKIGRVALDTLRSKGVDVRLQTTLAGVSPDGVALADGTSIPAGTVVWTAGTKANPIVAGLAGEKGKGGAARVEPDLCLPGHPEVYVVGDSAACAGKDGNDYPQLAQVAIQGGRHAAENISRQLAGHPTRPFRYHDHGSMATIGRRSAVADLPGGFHLRGTIGWFTWLGVHLVFLVGFRNRVVVLWNWAYAYLTWDRPSRVIIEERSRPGDG